MLDQRVAEAMAAGVDIARVMVDWAEIETEAGATSSSRSSAARFDTLTPRPAWGVFATSLDRAG